MATRPSRVAEDLETRLVNVPATYHNVLHVEDCPTTPELLVDPANVEQSLLLRKLMNTQACGDEMPKSPYPEWGTVNYAGEKREEFVACLRQWTTLLAEDYNRAR